MEIPHMNKLKILAPALVLVALLALAAGGCANNKKKAVNASVSDINVAPIPPKESDYTYGAPLGGAATTSTPSYYTTPAPAVTQTPAAGGAAPGGSYVVKKGDTLFSIAKTTYGSGNQWQRIASANPGLSPGTLKAGQTIVLP
jgi:nucleoid-associated protein YgaU